ncbi:pleckstrin homology domain-containing protein 1 [Artemisia annua]|uniref:Pleckstrin homology domain-containing protein 1 n=1 Tax=Artemisia annua TaxID=35608 RepID=A0A2U1PWS3_ARTAN|nr:pleckstrin homology domain-containing protein 1 [Artemisia annua]
MNTLWQTLTGSQPTPNEYNNIEFWTNPERTGFLTKQGEYIKTWRRRYFILKQGHIFWFKESTVTRGSNPRGVIPVGSCLTVKGAEDVIHKEYAFELSTRTETMYFIADSEKEKEDWINSIGRAIVQCSRSVVHDGNEGCIVCEGYFSDIFRTDFMLYGVLHFDTKPQALRSKIKSVTRGFSEGDSKSHPVVVMHLSLFHPTLFNKYAIIFPLKQYGFLNIVLPPT